MPLEDWVRHSRHDMFLYDWQTLITGVLALLAGIGTVWMTRHIVNKQIKATVKQIETTVRLERLRRANEDFAFYAMFESAMDRVLAEEAAVPQTGLGVTPSGRASARRRLMNCAARVSLMAAT
jgi:hypothetical protein